MRHRDVAFGVLLVLAVLAVGNAAIAEQTRGRAAQSATPWTAPRTPWGHPDLQGLWSNATTTPLERPDELKDKAVLSDQEFEQAASAVATRRNTDQAPRAGDPGTYNEFWWERGNLLKQTALIIDPPDGKVSPLTPEGQKRAQAFAQSRRGRGPSDSWEDRNLHERCILYHGVPPLPTGYNNNYQIAQTPDLVAIRSEMLNETRLIPLDGRPHLRPGVRQWMGDPRGRWEGNTLLVESTNFTDAAGGLYELGSVTNLMGTGSTIKIVERFTRTARDTIDYRFTVEDPSMFTKPWTGSIPMTTFEGRIYEYACHEGNYAMEGMLRGARVEEAAEAAKKK